MSTRMFMHVFYKNYFTIKLMQRVLINYSKCAFSVVIIPYSGITVLFCENQILNTVKTMKKFSKKQ
jgi:hypothetical protein